MENYRILEAVISSIECVKSEARPLQAGVSERAVAHRLAVHLESQFEDWDIDCEYNRRGSMSPKELDGIVECEERRTTNRILPDIIVHHRNNEVEPKDGDNLVVIELKNNNSEDVCDRRKLELFTDPKGNYKYQLGLYINVGDNEFTKTWYKDGVQIAEEELKE
jgi:hypothetical protein